jgi:hypothetical protein
VEAVIVNADTLNLPEAFAAKLRGREVEITEKDNIVTIAPVHSPIIEDRGSSKIIEVKRMSYLDWQCTIEDEMEIAHEIAHERGDLEGARRFINGGYDFQYVADTLELTDSQREELREEFPLK